MFYNIKSIGIYIETSANTAQEEAIKLFDGKQVRYIWDGEKGKYFFSVIDVIQVLTTSDNPRKYWSVLKTRLKQEGNEMATNCSQLKLQAADGKKYLTDVVLSLCRYL